MLVLVLQLLLKMWSSFKSGNKFENKTDFEAVSDWETVTSRVGRSKT